MTFMLFRNSIFRTRSATDFPMVVRVSDLYIYRFRIIRNLKCDKSLVIRSQPHTKCLNKNCDFLRTQTSGPAGKPISFYCHKRRCPDGRSGIGVEKFSHSADLFPTLFRYRSTHEFSHAAAASAGHRGRSHSPIACTKSHSSARTFPRRRTSPARRRTRMTCGSARA